MKMCELPILYRPTDKIHAPRKPINDATRRSSLVCDGLFNRYSKAHQHACDNEQTTPSDIKDNPNVPGEPNSQRSHGHSLQHLFLLA